MSVNNRRSDFPEHSDENREIWDANAEWWDDRIGDGNEFQNLLIEPATERLLCVQPGEEILDVACGAGRFARRMAELGARVVGVDYSAKFIERAKMRTPGDADIEYRLIDVSDTDSLLELGESRFDKAVCTMGLMDMPSIAPLMRALAVLLRPSGVFVFSVTHPCFHSAAVRRYAEMYEAEAGRMVVEKGVKISSYAVPFAKKSEGILGQPRPQFYFHRPLNLLLKPAFESGFVMDGMEEPSFAEPEEQGQGLKFRDMPGIPPLMVVRMRLVEKGAKDVTVR
jgi:2-polyprenyl-3-methyl-5-hydroxy-6-metoxy-1,4-benzoquinol methylase